jgi:hypothetical protein
MEFKILKYFIAIAHEKILQKLKKCFMSLNQHYHVK